MFHIHPVEGYSASWEDTLLKIGLLLVLSSCLFGSDHSRPVMEPYELAGKRIVFTNWFFVRPGHFDWQDQSGNSVFADSDAEIDALDAVFVPIDSPYGVRLFSEPAESEIPILETDKPWDKWGITLATLIHDQGKFRLWGTSHSDSKHKNNSYFESYDGENWYKPDLGLIEYDGNTSNNLLKDNVGLAVFVDPVSDELERYKTVWHTWIDPLEFEKYKHNRDASYYALELDKPFVHVLKGAYSKDGLTWYTIAEPLAFEHMDSQTIIYYDTNLRKYVLYSRDHMVGSRAEGHPYPALKAHQFVARRAICRSESDNFQKFPLSNIIIETESDMHPSDQFYTNCRTTIPGAPDHQIMFPGLYNVTDDENDILLYSSYDGKIWHKMPGEPVYKTQPFGAPDGGWIAAHPNLAERPNGDWILPYNGYNVPHKYPRGSYRFEPGLLIWPKGRLAGIEAEEIGAFATVAFVLPGKQLKINALTQRAGYIKIEVADMAFKPIAGHAFEDAIEIVGNHHYTTVRWRGTDQLGAAAGEPIMLRFQMKMAKIYGLQFD